MGMQCERLLVHKRLLTTWTVWRARLEQARQYQQLTDRALWHWSVLLQCKVSTLLVAASQLTYVLLSYWPVVTVGSFRLVSLNVCAGVCHVACIHTGTEAKET
jgi:hypothetical protein